MGEQMDPKAIELTLEKVALELLGGMFPGVDVAVYYQIAGDQVEAYLRGLGDQEQVMDQVDQFYKLYNAALNKTASTYVLITGKGDDKNVDKLMRNYEALVKIYLENKGIRIRDRTGT